MYSPAAKILLNYKIFLLPERNLVLMGKSTQVFLNKNNELQLYNPPFYLEWQKKWGQLHS
jgi:hypothetical protein